ncbi:MAG: mechanosensitive ion channel domain-containing protein [Waddliaceae bacterium]
MNKATPPNFLCLILLFFFIYTAEAKDRSAPIVDPVNLTVGWWKNFQDAKENQGNIDQLIEELQELKSQLDPDTHPLIIIEIDQVIFSAKKLQKMRSEEISYSPIQPLYLSRYTLADLLKVVDLIRAVKNQQQELEKHSELVRNKVDSLRNEIDYLQLVYLLKEEGTAEKLMVGMKIINFRFKIDVYDLEIKRMRRMSDLIDDNLSKLEKEKEIASKRIEFSNLREESILNRIEAGETLLLEANRQLLELNKTLLDEEELLEPRSMIANLYLQQVQAEIVFEKITLLIYQLEHGEPKKQVELALPPLRDQLDSIRSFAQNIQQQLPLMPPFEVKEYREALSSLAALQGKIDDSRLVLSQLEEKALEKDTTFEKYFLIFMNKIGAIVLSASTLMSLKIFRIDDYPVTLWVLIRALLILIGAVILGRISRRFFKTFQRLRSRLGRANTYILSRIVYYLIIILGVLAAIYSIGIGMTNFVIIAGALGIGVGLGLQAIVNNFFSGLVVLFTKILKVGDVVETGNGSRGIVKAIRMQNTHIRTFDGEDVMIPNADLVTKKVINWTMADPFIRLHVPFGVGYGTDRELVENIVLNAAKRIKYTITDKKFCPEPRVRFLDFGDSSLNLELVVWVNIKENPTRGYIKTQYLWEIEKELTKAGIDIPFPISDIRLVKAQEISLKQ